MSNFRRTENSYRGRDIRKKVHGRSEQLGVCGLLRMKEVGCSLIIPQVLDVCGLREVLLRGEACATGLMLRSERLDGHQLPLQMVIVSSRILFYLSSG